MHITVIQSAINFNLLKFVFLCTFVVVVIAGCSGRPSLLTHRAHSDGIFLCLSSEEIMIGGRDWRLNGQRGCILKILLFWIFLLLV